MRKIYLFVIIVLFASPVWAQVYTSNFGTATSGTPASPFTAGESTVANLTSAGWTGGTVLFAGTSGGAYCIGTSNGNGTYTLSLTVSAGFKLNVTGTTMNMRRTSTGPTVVAMTINGTSAPVTGAPGNGSFSAVSTSTAVNDITGSFTIVITTSGGTGSGQNVRLDDFVLNGAIIPLLGAGTSTITAGAGVEPATISSLVNTQGASALNFDFTVTDDGATPATDAVATQISQIVLTAGTGNAVTNWATAIAGAELSDGANGTTAATITANTITFSGLPNNVGELGHVADDAAKTYTLRIWLNSSMGALATTIDEKDFVFRITEGNVTNTGSTFAIGQDVNSGDGNNTVDVTASSLVFVQQPSNASTGLGMSPAVTVAAVDANGNRDLGFVSGIDITSTGPLTGSPVTASAVLGLASFSGLTHTAAGSFQLNAERNGTGDWDILSNSFLVVDPVLPGELLINQFSPDYGGASDEYVEIVNTTNKQLNLSTVALRYSSTGGSGPNTLATLTGTIEPHSYWLLSPNATISVGQTTSLTRDGSFTAGMATAGQVALVRTGDNVVIDGVGYGGVTVNVFTEGTAASSPPTDGGLRRVVDGVDANDNSTDFTTVSNGTIDLRNSSSRLANTGAVIPVGNYSRLYVTGNSSIGGAVTLSQRLVFGADGILSLNGNNLDISNSSISTAVIGHSTTRYVRTDDATGGSLIRAVATTGAYQFPVGTATELQLATIDFTATPTAGTLAVRFTSGTPVNKDITPTLSESGHTLNSVSSKGMWEIIASPAITEAYTATFEARNFSDFMVPSSLHLVKRADASSPWSLDGTHVPTTGDATLAVFSRTGMSGFSHFAPGGEFNVTLPVGLVTFSGYKQGSVNRLQWTTGSEQNNRGFEVLRSADGVNYTVLSFVNSQAANGNSSTDLTYSFVDNTPVGAKQYYRLRQVDLNGGSKLSNVVMIKGERPSTVVLDGLYPNPATSVVNVLVGAPGRDRVTVVVLDVTGRVMSQQLFAVEAGSNTIPVNVAGLTSGLYMVKLVCSSNCEAGTSRFIKQ